MNGFIKGTFALVIWICLIGVAQAGAPERIVSLAPSVTEILFDLGIGDKVIAVSDFCDYPPAARAKPKIGGLANPSLEAIVAMKPDMVVLTDDNPRQLEWRLRKLQIATHAFRAKRLDDLRREIRALGVALRVPELADRRAARIEKAIGRYKKKSRLPSNFPRKVLFVVQPDPLLVAGPGTAIDDVLKLLGLQNIAAAAKSDYPRYSLEEVLRLSPDIIFIARGHGNMTDQSRRLLKRLKDLDSVRQGRVYYIGDPLLRLGPRITEGIAEIAKWTQKSTVKNRTNETK